MSTTIYFKHLILFRCGFVFICCLLINQVFAQPSTLSSAEKERISLVQTMFTKYSDHPEKLLYDPKKADQNSQSGETANPAAASLNESLKNSFTVKGGGIFNFHSKENTKGSIYLFNDWVHGIVFQNSGQEIIDSSLIYNYNKLNGDLIVTQDMQNGLTIDRNLIAGFILLSSDNAVHIFTILPSVSNTQYCEVVGIGKNCAVVELTTTNFVKANFQTDGMTSTGHDYDEYVDKNAYYVLNLSINSINKFDLKKKSIKDAFADIPKANDFLQQHKNDEINNTFFKNLCDATN